MKIVIAGGTGFLGRPLAAALAKAGHTPLFLSRRDRRLGTIRVVEWQPDGTVGGWANELSDADAVITLAGESIDAGRWSTVRKKAILESRLLSTRSLVEAIQRSPQPPRVLVSGSGVNYYGLHDRGIVSEDAPPGTDYLADVCVQWEAEAMRAAGAGTRVACLRTGLVVAGDGGALSRMLLPFRLGLGGPVGSGRQHWSWIHRQDWIDLARFVLDNAAVSGPVNATAPNPVTSREFAATLGAALHRPAVLPLPAAGLKLLFGEMAESLLLSGQRATPSKAQRAGFKFAFPTLQEALGDILGP